MEKNSISWKFSIKSEINAVKKIWIDEKKKGKTLGEKLFRSNPSGPHESGNIWNCILFYTNRPFIHMKPVNPLTRPGLIEAYLFWTAIWECFFFFDPTHLQIRVDDRACN